MSAYIITHPLYSFLLLSFLLTSSGFFVIAVCGSISVRELVKYLKSLQTDVELPSPMISQTNECPHLLCFFLIPFLFKVNCGLYIVCYLCQGR